MRALALTLLSLGIAALSGCGSPCSDACQVYAGKGCADVVFNGKVHASSVDTCISDCENNNHSLCEDSSSPDANSKVLDCMAQVDCSQSEPLIVNAEDRCIIMCPTHR